MSLIAMTMLRVHEPARDEWRDAIDVRWTAFLARCGLHPLYVPNDGRLASLLLDVADPVGVVLTGGGSCSALSGLVDDRDSTESVALEWAAIRSKPVLGICRGMQVMLARAGAELKPVLGHVGCRHAVSGSTGRRAVNSFHEYGFQCVPRGYVVQAQSTDGVVEAAFNRALRHTAVMWHPEREIVPDPADLAMFRKIFGEEQ